ncbi:TPA: fimbria/pilus outer membrane usher protein, partial [Escherichia coli]|nr:fimbria/pilus outer membrane usher protein [Escherichia coli]HDV1661841.1 fimbria/pilus outer membrane usher protein [Escherichia coli]HDV2742296.1 fimbria/pilus outer membrane usher protein [Escherichia coli]HDV2819414.1 fimbria/pilus outer membrane usher protein [Escherichia coli]HDV2828183.1 fimbria/pilus outer membrane usher protein [Escherichia coli]
KWQHINTSAERDIIPLRSRLTVGDSYTDGDIFDSVNFRGLKTGENVSLGTVNKSKVPLGLSATYGQTGNKVSAGTVQSVIGVTFIYE